MWIKRQEGYCLKKIAGVQYLLPYGQKVADQKKGILLNDTGVFLWNELNVPMTEAALAEKLVMRYTQDEESETMIQEANQNSDLRGPSKDCNSDHAIQDQIRQDVKQFVQELIALEILRECPEFERDENGRYPTNQPFAGYLKIAGMAIALYGDRELISSQFDAFFFDVASDKTYNNKEYKEDNNSPDSPNNQKNQNNQQTQYIQKNPCKQNMQQLDVHSNMPVDMQIEFCQRMPHVHPNGQTLIRNEELEVNKTKQGYLVRFPSMKQIREAHMTSDGSFVQIYLRGWDKEQAKEELFHAIRHFFLFLAQRKDFLAIHSASILYREQVWLFSGHSGMGKSTHTNLWKQQFGTEIINGDLNLIGWDKSGRPIVYGMPWCGTSGIASINTYPLGGITLLGRASDNHFEPLKTDQKIVRVMQRMISPVWECAMLEQNLKAAETLSNQIPIFHFLCTKEPSAAEKMKDAIDQIQGQIQDQVHNQIHDQIQSEGEYGSEE